MDHTRKRLTCSVFFVRLLLAALAVLCLTWPWLLKLLIRSRAPDLAGAYPLLLAVLYAATLLVCFPAFYVANCLRWRSTLGPPDGGVCHGGAGPDGHGPREYGNHCRFLCAD